MDVHIEDDSVIRLKEGSHIQVDDGSKMDIQATVAPIAVHLKELNNIDPISVDSLFVSQVRDIEPLEISKLNVTGLPVMNMALRQLPPVDLNIGRLPAVSIGLHQVFEMPSNYVLRAQILGFELFRIHLCGRTRIAPTERFRQEQDRADSRSFPNVAAAGNPAIPSIRKVQHATYTGAGCAGNPRPCLRVGQGGSPMERGTK